MAHVKAALELVKLGAEVTSALIDVGRDAMEAHQKYKEMKEKSEMSSTASSFSSSSQGDGVRKGGDFAQEFAASFAKLERCSFQGCSDARYGTLNLKKSGLMFKASNDTLCTVLCFCLKNQLLTNV